MSTPEALLFAWFGGSVVAAVLGNLVLFLWLRARKVDMWFGMTGVPGYLDLAYLSYCRGRGTSPLLVLALRTASLISVAAAAIVFYLHVTNSPGSGR